MKSALFVSACLLLLAGGLSIVLWSDNRQLKLENAQLRARVTDLELSSRTASPPLRGEAPSPESQAQTRELMRLRNEITQLRTQRDGANRPAARVNVDVPPRPVAGESVAPDDWRFEGYDTPESAFISGMWAMKEGQREALLNSFTPEERQRFETQMKEKTDADIAARFQKEFGRVTGVRVLAQRETAPGEVVLDVYLEGLGALKKYRLNQVGNEWKAGGPINQNPAVSANAEGAYDPTAFYRRNPELMKRYFPHLVKEVEQRQAAQQTAPAQ